MKKRTAILSVVIGVASLAAIGGGGDQSQSSKYNNTKHNDTSTTQKETSEKINPTCDGMTVTAGCVLDGVHYKTYVYHPAVAEKSHAETVTTYQKQVTGYCTLCNDGTYSPSCATGKGACSHHGGVSQWNAPIYSNVPVYDTKTVVDVSAQDAYYEKVTE
jgi:hypothetical protein